VIADHGYGFEPAGPVRAMRGEHDDNEQAIAEILWVPFFLKEAGQRDGTISDAPVRTIDMLPTLASVLDVDIPWEVEGRSAFDGGSGDRDEVGLFLTVVDGDDVNPGPYRSIDRERGLELLMERTTGEFVPKTPRLSGSDRIYGAGPRPDLWMEPIPDGLTELDVDIHPDATADDVDLGSGRLPALFRASTDVSHVGETVAIGVNGTIAATATAHANPFYADDELADIIAVVPPVVFRDGANELTVHVVD